MRTNPSPQSLALLPYVSPPPSVSISTIGIMELTRPFPLSPTVWAYFETGPCALSRREATRMDRFPRGLA